MKTCVGYKIVKREDNSLVSAVPLSRRVVYQEDEWTQPRCGDGPLTVFDDRELANQYAGMISRSIGYACLVYEVRYVPSRCKSIWTMVKKVKHHTAGRLGAFCIYGQATMPGVRKLEACPTGTRLAQKVMLVKHLESIYIMEMAA